jgi:FixJ family two-component response regulator
VHQLDTPELEMARILIMHPERSARKTLEAHASQHHHVQSVSSLRGALKCVVKARPQVAVVGLNGQRSDAFEFLRHMQRTGTRLPTIVVASGRSGAFQAMAMKMGAVAFLEYPVEQQALNQTITKTVTAEWTAKGEQPPITDEESAANLTELEEELNRHMRCFAGKNQVYLQSFILGGGRKSKPRIALKCPLRQEYGDPPNVYYEYVRDVCCGDPTVCSAYQTFKAKHPD